MGSGFNSSKVMLVLSLGLGPLIQLMSCWVRYPFNKNGLRHWVLAYTLCNFGFLNHSLSMDPRMELELFLFKITKWASSTGVYFILFFQNDQVSLKYRTWAFLFNMTRWILSFWIWALNFLESCDFQTF